MIKNILQYFKQGSPIDYEKPIYRNSAKWISNGFTPNDIDGVWDRLCETVTSNDCPEVHGILVRVSWFLKIVNIIIRTKFQLFVFP